MLRGYSWFMHTGITLGSAGDHMGCWELNPGQPHARQMPYPLCYHSSPCISFLLWFAIQILKAYQVYPFNYFQHSVLFFFLFFGGRGGEGHTQRCSGVTPGSCTQELFLVVLGDHMRCWGLNPGRLQARLMPYPLCYCSSPNIQFLSSTITSNYYCHTVSSPSYLPSVPPLPPHLSWGPTIDQSSLWHAYIVLLGLKICPKPWVHWPRPNPIGQVLGSAFLHVILVLSSPAPVLSCHWVLRGQEGERHPPGCRRGERDGVLLSGAQSSESCPPNTPPRSSFSIENVSVGARSLLPPTTWLDPVRF
ncbi:uncharacterized protein LOC129401977 [Sorex araneus]|uniref:uncharacterized protein LOC129401977 n=1 Tax=Sorex araneus TaxID=42254 RepID=UPI002433A965|nr:uncharacterized protein LOC129401977 [Sorex araneus]